MCKEDGSTLQVGFDARDDEHQSQPGQSIILAYIVETVPNLVRKLLGMDLINEGGVITVSGVAHSRSVGW